MLDESFALGITGLRGAGLSETLPVNQRPRCVFSGLSFGFSGIGACVAGDRVLVDYLVNQSRTFASESALPAAYAAGMEVAFDELELRAAVRERLKSLGLLLKRGLATLGIAAGDESPCPLVCLPFERRKTAEELSAALFERGFLLEVAPRGVLLDAGAVLRVLINAAHREADIESLLRAIAETLPRCAHL